MKAANRPPSKDQFKRLQKPQQDIQSNIDKIQRKTISEMVGIDQSEQQKFQWFYDLLTTLRLPKNYKRYFNAQKDKVIYYNMQKQEEQFLHPQINNIKIFFYQTLTDNKSVHTFSDKERKLLPFVQEKMIRQSIGLSSKRRDAQKVNLKRDQSGRLVINKMERIVPDFKPLIASRSYVIKMLVQKLFTKRQILGKGKRANAYTNLIAQYRKQMKQNNEDIQDIEIQNEEKLALYQKIFQQSGYFYVMQFGNLVNIPPSILHSRQYVQSTPQNVLKNIFLLNIDKDNIQLYWFGRIMDCLPMPPNWTKRKGATFDSYFYEPQKCLFDIHPSYIYIMYQMNKFRSTFRHMDWMIQNYYLGMRQLNFYDFFQRSYTVDMYGYKENAERKNLKSQGKSRNKEKNPTKANQTSDWMILQGVRNTQILAEHLILIQHIQKYWQSLDFRFEAFIPAVSPFGQVIWSSNINNKSITFNPYKNALSHIIQSQAIKVPKITQNMLKQRFQNKQNQIQEVQQDFKFNYQKLQKQRYNFLSYYLTHNDKALPFPYQIKQQLPLLNQNNFYEQLFVCPFQLDQGIIKQNQKMPFWLEKVKAKQFTDQSYNLLLFNPQDFNVIKEKISDFILEMVGFHEPHTYEQTQKKIKRLSNPQQLLRFLSYITDLDARQQRKKQYLESLIVEDDSDIFGSDISQVQPQEFDNESSQQAPKQQQKQQQPKQIINQPQIIEQSQQQIQTPTQIIIIPQQQIIIQQIKEDYSFLQHFTKKIFLKNIKLQKLQEQQIQNKLKNIIKQKIKKNKYKNNKKNGKVTKQILFTKNVLKNNIFSNKSNQFYEDRLKIKKNLIVSNLRHSKIPYKFSQKIHFKQYQIQKGTCLTQYNYSQISDYSEFRSEIQEYQNQQVQYMINEIRKQKFLQAKFKTQSQRYQQNQQTQDTIQLDPIYQIKPEIKRDPVLRHIKQVSQELDQFRNTFNSKIIKPTPQKEFKKQLNQVKSLKKLNNLQSNYSSLPNTTRDNFVKKSQRSEHQSRRSLTKKQSFSSSLPKFQTPHKAFYRVCLEHTASHFLEKQAFLRKGDLITMQARKTLLSKGRGLQTFISKFY